MKASLLTEPMFSNLKMLYFCCKLQVFSSHNKSDKLLLACYQCERLLCTCHLRSLLKKPIHL